MRHQKGFSHPNSTEIGRINVTGTQRAVAGTAKYTDVLLVAQRSRVQRDLIELGFFMFALGLN